MILAGVITRLIPELYLLAKDLVKGRQEIKSNTATMQMQIELKKIELEIARLPITEKLEEAKLKVEVDYWASYQQARAAVDEKLIESEIKRNEQNIVLRQAGWKTGFSLPDFLTALWRPALGYVFIYLFCKYSNKNMIEVATFIEIFWFLLEYFLIGRPIDKAKPSEPVKII
jgi:hypothetical protein